MFQDIDIKKCSREVLKQVKQYKATQRCYICGYNKDQKALFFIEARYDRKMNDSAMRHACLHRLQFNYRSVEDTLRAASILCANCCAEKGYNF